MGAEDLGSLYFPKSYEKLSSPQEDILGDIDNNIAEPLNTELDNFMNNDPDDPFVSEDVDDSFYGEKISPVGTIVPVEDGEEDVDDFMSTTAFEDGFGTESSSIGSGSTVIGDNGTIRLGN